MRIRTSITLVLLAAFSGCVIGTWPTPEGESSGDKKSPRTTLGSEVCDNLDNDADGSVDEGCPCKDQVRGCIGEGAQGCGLGVQWCVGGTWAECSDLGPPFTVPVTPSVTVRLLSASAVLRDDAGAIAVAVDVVTRCAGIQTPAASVMLSSSQPQMATRAIALDDGAGADVLSADGTLSAELANPFGPGVASNVLTLRATVVVNEKSLGDVAEVSLEAAP